MKKYTLICAAMCAAMVFTSCKSSESAYKQAYLKAKQQEEMQQQAPAAQETNMVTPMVERPVNNTQVVDNADNIAVRQEQVTVVSGGGLKNFSEGLQQTLRSEGYDAQIVMNNNVTPAMYRVVATTFDSKVDAAASRNGLQNKYPGAWLLYAK